MAGWNIDFGELKDNSSTNFFAVVSKSLLSKQHKTTTYKFCFFKCLLDNIFLVDDDYQIDFKTLNKTFIEVYWNLVSVHEIPQTYAATFKEGSSIERLINDYCELKPSSRGISFDFLSSETIEHLRKKSLTIFKKYVVGAFYSDTGGLLYGFSKKEGKLTFNEKSLNFLTNNKVLLEQINYYEWLKYCESVLTSSNKTVDNLSLKLEWITKRTSLLKYKNILNNLNEEKVCFYCGKKCNSSSHLDHVIPWDFMKKDELWDLVWSCPHCNCSKNDRIPDEYFINKLIERNKKLGIVSPDIKKIVNIAKENGIEVGWNPNKN